MRLFVNFESSTKRYCRVLKLADKPSDLGGGGSGTKQLFDLTLVQRYLPNRSVEVRFLPLQQKSLSVWERLFYCYYATRIW